MGSTVGQTHNLMLVFCEYSQAPTLLQPPDYALWSLDLFSVFKCSQKYKNFKNKILGTWLRWTGILQLSLQRAGGPTISAGCYDSII